MMGALATERNLPLRRSHTNEFQPASPAAGAITIDGEIVLIELNFKHLNGKESCVVVRGDGSIGIEKPWNGLKFWCTGPRGAYYDITDHPEAKDGRASVACVVIGKVIEAA